MIVISTKVVYRYMVKSDRFGRTGLSGAFVWINIIHIARKIKDQR